MRAPFAQTWAVKKHAPRRAARRVSQAPVPESDSDSDDDTPEVGAVAFGTVKKGEAIKDGSKRSKFGAALKVVLAVFSLLRSTAKNPLLPYARGRPGKYYHKSHRNELSAGVSRYLADAFFAACSGLQLPPLAQYSAKLDNGSAQQAERATLERQLYHVEARGGTCYITAVTRAINSALGIQLTAQEISDIFPVDKNAKGLRSIDKKALQAALAAHGVTVDPLRIIILRVFGTEYAQRLKDMDAICGQALDLKTRLKTLQVEADEASKEKTGEKTAPVATRLPRAKAAGGGRRSGKRKPKVARDATPRPASPVLADEPDTDGEDGEDMPDDEVEDVSLAEDLGWVRTLLVAEAAMLPEHERESMHSLIPDLRARPLFDKVLRANKAPTFIPPPWLLQPGREADLEWWNSVVAKVKALELAGVRVLGFEVVLQRPGQAARVLFACFGEVACTSDSLGCHSILSYVDSDRSVLQDGTPSDVRAAINRALMLAMVVKLFRCGATWLWLSACSPKWWWCKKTKKIYPDYFCVATSGLKYGKDVPRSFTDKQVEEMKANAKADRDAKLRDVVYPELLKHGQFLGIMAPGAGKWVATPGAGAMTPTFVDDVFTKQVLEACEKNHQPAPPGSYQPSFLDAELAASNKVAQMFMAQLTLPEDLSVHAQQFAEMYEQLARTSRHEADFCARRSQKLEQGADRVMKRSRVPAEYWTLGEGARHKLRADYLAMQKNPLST